MAPWRCRNLPHRCSTVIAVQRVLDQGSVSGDQLLASPKRDLPNGVQHDDVADDRGQDCGHDQQKENDGVANGFGRHQRVPPARSRE